MATNNAEINTEALQAQIDLSMSVVHGMISSWVKSPPGAQNHSTKGVDEELREYMKRPSRLGVGAAITESSAITREAARLKVRLVDREAHKRPREGSAQSTAWEADDEESRASAIKKKPRINTFPGAKSKKKGESNSLVVVPSIDARSTNNAETVDGALSQGGEQHQVQTAGAEHEGGQGIEEPNANTPESTNPSPSNHSPSPDHSNDIILTANQQGSTLDNTNYDVSSDAPLHAHAIPDKALNIQTPLLNLDGPISVSGVDGNEKGPYAGETKKKRKRRKKKKNIEAAVQGS
ncbi:hypothetical protein AX16_001011 [Volvariella volvacea WC 439]|nr:hypothetical protein AX16_001011 [Volvariella volvacea WC 439]